MQPARGESEIGSGRVRLAPRVSVDPGLLKFAFSSSSGPGGQNVNKRATKAELRVRLEDLPLPAGAPERLAALAGDRLTSAGELVIVSDEHRSQGRNKDACIERLSELVRQALVVPKRRKATRPTHGSKLRRLDEKKRRSGIKRGRTGGDED